MRPYTERCLRPVPVTPDPSISAMDRALLHAAEGGHDDALDALIKSGADVNIVSDKGYTALYFAIKNRYNRCAELLIKSGADVDVQDHKGITPLICAVKMNNFSLSIF